MMNANSAKELSRLEHANNILLLQGPMGPFMRRFSDFLKKHGKQVFKINLNGGDQFFYHSSGTYAFTKKPIHWRSYIKDFIDEHKIEHIFLYGDCRFYHSIAIKMARVKGIRVSVFEEGYIRPDYVTLEDWGVNHHSVLPRNANFYRAQILPEPSIPVARAIKFSRLVMNCMAYYAAGFILGWHYRYYQHHKNFSPLIGLAWCRSFYRKQVYKFTERHIMKKLQSSFHKRFYLIPLQVFNDSQVLQHYDQCSVTAFIAYVMNSFAENAPKDTVLVLKHHPMDRGQSNYASLIKQLSFELKLEQRVYYVHDLHLPSLLDSALGTVVINSTVGLSSLLHKTPVKTVGNCLYDFDGLTSQLRLDDFWTNVGKVNDSNYKAFRRFIIHQTQINANFQSSLPYDEFERFFSSSEVKILQNLANSTKPVSNSQEKVA